jgi:hypothetical protein
MLAIRKLFLKRRSNQNCLQTVIHITNIYMNEEQYKIVNPHIHTNIHTYITVPWGLLSF